MTHTGQGCIVATPKLSSAMFVVEPSDCEYTRRFTYIHMDGI